jgi:pseudaminic acid cytidylyltransferase
LKKLCVIPARGGSKRIPRKNIKHFAGRPMLSYPIRAALESGLFNHVIVSTEDEEIAALARAEGATVPFLRPLDLADDQTGTGPVTNHAIRFFAAAGDPHAITCCLYATTPFVTAQRLREGYDLLMLSGRSFAFTVTSYAFPIQRALRRTADGGVEPFSPDDIPKRSQDLEPAFHDAGQFYIGKSEAFLAGKAMFSAEAAPFILPRHLVHDIDTPEDWLEAELAYQVLEQSGRL